MTSQPILYETHMHTPLCKHAKGEPEAYAAVAEQRGLKGIIVTCHNPTDNGWAPEVRMRIDQFDEYVALVDRARQAWAGRVDVRLGLESDYAPGMEGWLEKLHRRAEFHYILGSVHALQPEYKERYFNGDVVAFQRLYFEHLALAAETGLFDSLAHPDLVKNIQPQAWNLEPIMDDIRRGHGVEHLRPQQSPAGNEPRPADIGGDGSPEYPGGRRRRRPRPPAGSRQL